LTLVLLSLALFAFTWAGYPLVIALLAALRPARRAAVAGELPTVTAVVATRDDADTIRRRVENLLASDYPADRLDVVVALDAAGALADPDVVRALGARVAVVQGDAPGGKAAALNAAVRQAGGDVLVFADAAQTFAPDAVRRLVDALADPAVGAASGQLEIPPRADGRRSIAEHYWRYERWLRAAEARLHSTVGVTGAIYATRRALWEPLPAGLILDDAFVPMRLVLRGQRIAFVREAHAVDVRRFEAGQEMRRKTRTLTGVLQLCAWLPGVLRPWANPIWFQFVCHKLLRLLTPYLLLAMAAGTLWAFAGALRAAPQAVLPVAALAAVAAAVVLGHPGLRRRTRSIVVQVVALQVAVVVATANGARGRWDVWQR
jgi:cellulose synthase/poly-beta-1,6-N-acetylglucosamine synthase-like glycosyltransferase